MPSLQLEQLLALLFDPRLLQLQERQHTFNPLKVLRMQRSEIRHVNTLSWLLDPEGSHHLGDAFLKRFVASVAGQAQPEKRIDVLLRFACTSDAPVRIRREVSTADLARLHDSDIENALNGAPTTDDVASDTGASLSGALDLLLEGERWILAIEAKVESGLHGDQLYRYYQALAQGAPNAQVLYVFLNINPEDGPGDSRWIHATWQSTVIAPLRDLLASRDHGMDPYTREFIASYLDVLEEQCGERDSLRETLFAQLLVDHDDILSSICGRDASKLDADLRKVISANVDIVSELARRYRSPAQRRLSALRAFVGALPDVTLARSGTSALRFTPNEWLRHDWMHEPEQPYPRVVCELLNDRDRGIRFKLMVRDLSETDAADPIGLARRLSLYRAAQSHPESPRLFKSTLNAGNVPRRPDPKYAALTLTPWHSCDASSAAEAAQAAYISFRQSIDAVTELMNGLVSL